MGTPCSAECNEINKKIHELIKKTDGAYQSNSNTFVQDYIDLFELSNKYIFMQHIESNSDQIKDQFKKVVLLKLHEFYKYLSNDVSYDNILLNVSRKCLREHGIQYCKTQIQDYIYSIYRGCQHYKMTDVPRWRCKQHQKKYVKLMKQISKYMIPDLANIVTEYLMN